MPYNRQRPRRRFIFFPLVAIMMLLLFGLVVMLLWNAILPEALHAGRLKYRQAVGLLVLCRILFGGFGGPFRGRWPGGGGPAWRNKWTKMTPEEQERFKAEWQRRCGRKSNERGAAPEADRQEGM